MRSSEHVHRLKIVLRAAATISRGGHLPRQATGVVSMYDIFMLWSVTEQLLDRAA